MTSEDLVAAGDDGVVFLPAGRAGEITALAGQVHDTERRQATRIAEGISLRHQAGFGRYLARRQREPALTFRQHLRDAGGAIEV